MKKVFFALLVVFFSTACADEKKVLKAITAPNYEPYEFLDHGKLRGFDVDIMSEIAARAGFTLEYKFMDFDALIPTLKSGKADIIAAIMKKTPLREKAVEFTVDFKHSSNYLIAATEQKGEILACSEDDFRAKKIGAEMGSVQFDIAKSFGVEPSGFSEAGVAVMALLAGKLDALVLDRQAAQKFIAKNPRLAAVCEQADEGGQGFAMNKNDPRITQINAALKSMLEDGTVDKLSEKWGL